MSTENAIGALGGFIFTMGMISVLFHAFRIQDLPKKWKDEIKNMYVPEVLRKEEEKPE